ncbi:hypothetical protein ACG3JJ_08395 [Streptococcus parauberis]|uniref:V-type ATP synthase subunit G n=3 Tax=Streptococcus parauberis TaxID=1348 RepID=F1YY22_9STRE|nr:hypothetical protein [Streptococcus parauberis]AEF24921.1 hypothetical protein STP_0473 [Streptococcus parauberis KCTC 11537]AUT05698.1 hypothetical protein SPSF3K_00973 [Streptococcus parauberis]EGE53107.1 hypothetical protein SPB_0220 [Streptococcus parauberis NCFD 2020]EMG26217.1 hypothetical protein SPJ1_0179 [Streptococcus parauberis KRS-02083]MDT2730933.1 hypothetical protein [Streptococcus parauberis]
MSQSILTEMTSIEAEAKAISDSFLQKKKDYKIQKNEEITKLKATYDVEIQNALTEKEFDLINQLKLLESKVLNTQEMNKEKAEAIMKDNKETIINQIVDKVVSTYGY